MVSQPNRLFQRSTTMSLINKIFHCTVVMHCENLDLTLQKTSTMMHSRICTSFIVDISTYIFPQYGIVVEKFILAQYKLRPHTLYNKFFAMCNVHIYIQLIPEIWDIYLKSILECKMIMHI